MNNLKRVLSLALASVMLVGMMVVGSSAADFTDADKISNTEAVNSLVSLGVINGKDDGAFDPEGIVTRSQMAKMICVALNGGKDFKYGVKATPTYTDIKGHWAESYIEYCTSLGIIAGQGNGTFAPDAPVTGSAAAKMMLVAIGYDATEEAMVGADWEINTNRLATDKGFYEDLDDVDVSKGLSRDNAAQLIWNACDANLVEYDYKVVTGSNGQIATKGIAKDKTPVTDILGDKFGLQDKEGYMISASYNKDKDEYTYTFDKGATYGYNAAEQIDAGDASDTSLKTSTDYTGLLGHKVRVLYKNNTSKTVYGMYSSSGKVLAATKADVTGVGTAGAMASGDTEIKVFGTKEKLGTVGGTAVNPTTLKVYKAPSSTAYTQAEIDDVMGDSGTLNCASITFFGKDKIDYAVIVPADVRKVTYVNKDGITAGSSYTFEDDKIEEGVKKDDYVQIVATANSVYGINTITKLEVVTGVVEATKSGEAKVNGVWYKLNGNAVTLGEEYELAVIGKTVYNAKQLSEGGKVSQLVMVAETGDGPSFGVARTKLYFTDGTSQIVNVSKVDGTAVGSAVPSGFYTYEIKSEKYELTNVTGPTAGVDYYAASGNDFGSKKFNGKYIADDAVIFLTNSNQSKAKVITGADAKKWNASDLTDATIEVLYNQVNGMPTTQAAFVQISGTGALPGVAGDSKYGFVLTTPERIKNGSDSFWSYKVWTADGEMDVLEDSTSTAATKGAPISFKDKGDNKIDTVTAFTTADVAALTGIGGKELQFHDTGAAKHTYTLDNDSVILYVNTKDDKGVTGGELALANELSSGAKITNVWVKERAGEAGKVDVIVYDVNNDLDNFANNTATGAIGYTVATATIASSPAGWSIEQDKTVACEGEVVTVKITSTGAGTQTSATTTVTGAAAPGAVTLTASTAKEYTIKITVGTANITAITVTLS